MKRFISITILMSFLMTTTEAHELLKLPGMYIHFNEHSSKDKSIGVGEFIYIHYLADHPHQDDDGDEEPMPFKDHHCILTIVAPAQFKSVSVQTKNSPQLISIPVQQDAFISGSYTGNIWQPPKAV